MEKKIFIEKTALPIAIVIAAVVLAVGLYAVQYNKQESIERQQQRDLREDRAQTTAENERAELMSKQDECRSLSSGVMKQWNNVIGVTYDDELWEECVVTYTDTETGEIETAPLRLMQDAD